MIEEWMQSAARSPQGSPYGGVALGHAPQQPNTGMGPNRYIPPTFNYSTNTPTGRPNYQQMDWNQVQQYYTPNNSSQGQMTNGYMQQLQSMLGQFGQQYGGPNRRPTMPNFSSYNPGFGGATSYYDQQMPQQGYGYGQQGYSQGQMPQFNPYMMMQNSMRGMDFNQMFDPRYASLFGGNSFGSRTPNSQQPQQPGAGGAGPAADLIGNTKPMQGGGG